MRSIETTLFCHFKILQFKILLAKYLKFKIWKFKSWLPNFENSRFGLPNIENLRFENSRFYMLSIESSRFWMVKYESSRVFFFFWFRVTCVFFKIVRPKLEYKTREIPRSFCETHDFEGTYIWWLSLWFYCFLFRAINNWYQVVKTSSLSKQQRRQLQKDVQDRFQVRNPNQRLFTTTYPKIPQMSGRM